MNVSVPSSVTVVGALNASVCVSNPGACGEASLDIQALTGIAQGGNVTFWNMAQGTWLPEVCTNT
jgi:hypothetical protein